MTLPDTQDNSLKKLSALKWVSIGLHTILLIFALLVTFSLTGIDILAAFKLSKTDAALQHALSLSGLLVIGNLLGIILIFTPLFRSFMGSCFLLIYELAFLGGSLLFLSPDYSVVIGFIACVLLYVAHMHWKLHVK